MNDVERNSYETQLAELELLMSMYPSKGELVFDDASELANLRAALDSGDARIHVGGVGFTLHLSVMQVLDDSRLPGTLCWHWRLSCSVSGPCNFPKILRVHEIWVF